MKKLLLLFVAILGFVACEKDDINRHDDELQILRNENAGQRNQIAALQTAIDNLQSEVSSNDGDIAANAEGIVSANEAIASNLDAINSNTDGINTNTASITALIAELTAVESDLLYALDQAVAELKDAIDSGDLALSSELSDEVAALRDEIDSAQAAAEAYADLNDSDTVSDHSDLIAQIGAVSNTLADVEYRVDTNTIAITSLTANSFSYDDTTGFLTITLNNGEEYVTGDLRGSDGSNGADGADGQDGATGDTGAQGGQGIQGEVGPQGPIGATGVAGLKGDTGASGADGSNGEDGVSPTIGVAITDTGITLTVDGTDYFVSNGNDGAAGADGADGADGANGLGADGYDVNGFDADGYDADGYNADGLNSNGNTAGEVDASSFAAGVWRAALVQMNLPASGTELTQEEINTFRIYVAPLQLSIDTGAQLTDSDIIALQSELDAANALIDTYVVVATYDVGFTYEVTAQDRYFAQVATASGPGFPAFISIKDRLNPLSSTDITLTVSTTNAELQARTQEELDAIQEQLYTLTASIDDAATTSGYDSYRFEGAGGTVLSTDAAYSFVGFNGGNIKLVVTYGSDEVESNNVSLASSTVIPSTSAVRILRVRVGGHSN